ncbi:uncharacterized protein BCR38DRAFT_408778 [Pseudomassariella vexata]|uniref:Ring-like domain-containing protein n=1 Tax=Pseudomassariella vexata TaxID=1141098 RepID=A0A1Y2E112_9PEZI|nr:uncharacterized protein BCR38DRAFT_408778 [Pseudomassariella vexata]ORY65034.1 hypothetical protein BCR38DRAFT_408778 [Pseudomassariella vexata]
MLEYFAYKKVKKNRDDKESKKRQEHDKQETKHEESNRAATPPRTVISKPEPVGTPVLNQEDEKFLERLTSPDATVLDDDDAGPPPPLPPRVATPVVTWDSDTESFVSKDEKNAKGKGKAATTTAADDKKSNRFSTITNLGRTISLRVQRKPVNKDSLHPTHLAVPEGEVRREETDISAVLEDLNLSASNNKAFSLSADSTEMVRKFTLVLKDLVNGVPTAYQDLVDLIEDRDGLLAKNYERLPNGLKKLVTTLPNKLTTTLAPELLAVAAEAQGLNAAEASKDGLKGAAKHFMQPKNLQELVTKPGAVVGMLKGIVNVLKTRWPAFIGTNVLWSVAIFLLLSVLWYCHKRGREERLLKEGADKEGPIDGSTRIEELPDDPQLPAPGQESVRSQMNLSPAPAGENANASPIS